jgi:hypothetical protein
MALKTGVTAVFITFLMGCNIAMGVQSFYDKGPHRLLGAGSRVAGEKLKKKLLYLTA